jgi:hypothetical protein
MKGYGELNPEAAQSVEDLASELQGLLRRMRDYSRCFSRKWRRFRCAARSVAFGKLLLQHFAAG